MAASKIVAVDQALSQRIYEAANHIVPRQLLKALELSGDGRVWIPVPVAVLLTVRSGPPARVAAGLLAGFLIDLVFVGLLKHLVRRSRPKYNRDMFRTFAVDNWSFPSGHSSRVFFISSFLYLVRSSLQEVFEEEFSTELFVMAVFLWSMTTAASRILLGRHFVFDVVAGGCLGVIEALLVFFFFDFFRIFSSI